MTLSQGHDTPLGMDNKCVKYCPDPTWQWGVMVRTHILLCVHFDLDLGGMTLGQGHNTHFGHGQQMCEILSISNMAVRSYGPDTEFGYVCTVTWRYTLGQGYDTPLGHGQQLCEILSRSNMAVRSYGPDTDFGYMTFTLEIWPWVRSWHILGSWTIIMWNIIQIRQGIKKLWPRHDVNRHTDGRTDRQTDRVIPIYPPQTLFAGGINTVINFSLGTIKFTVHKLHVGIDLLNFHVKTVCLLIYYTSF